MPVANGMPLAAIGAGEEVPPCCVTVIRSSIGRWLSRPEFSEYSNSTTVLRNDARCIPCDQGGTRTLPSTYE